MGKKLDIYNNQRIWSESTQSNNANRSFVQFSENICLALDYIVSLGAKAVLMSAKAKYKGSYNTIILNVDEYHTSEVLTLTLFYQLIHGADLIVQLFQILLKETVLMTIKIKIFWYKWFLFSYKLIFQDFDGVIKDSVSVKGLAYKKTFEEFGEIKTSQIMEHHINNDDISRYKKIPLSQMVQCRYKSKR